MEAALPFTVREFRDLMRRTEGHLDALTQAQLEFAQAQRQMAEAQRRMQDDIGRLKESDLEHRYRERGHVYLGEFIDRARALTTDQLYRLLEHAIEAGHLTRQEAREIERADVVIRGRREEDRSELYLVGEVSWGVGLGDVERAERRAALLAKTGVQAQPVVAGIWITPDAEELARARKVPWRIDREAAPPVARDRPSDALPL